MSRAVDVGGGSIMAIESLKEEERAFLRGLLSGEDRACFIADPLLKRGDPCISEYYTATVCYSGDQVFHVVDTTTEEEAFGRAVEAAPFWMDLRVVTGASPQIRPGREIGIDDLIKCAAMAISLSCSAYDGEGFVVWRKT